MTGVLKRKTDGKSTTNGHETKKKKAKKSIINDDEQDLQTAYFESEQAYHSTVTRMKVNALLNEVTLKEAHRAEIDQFIEEISSELKSIPQGKVRPSSTMPEWLKKFDLAMPLEFAKLKKTFQFLPPTTIVTIGSYVHNSLIVKSASKNSIVVDVLVEMPRLCIHKKDYLNNEYVEKRAIYLCYLAKKLKQTPEYRLKFSHLSDTTGNQAVLLVKPHETSAFVIRILLAPEQNYLSEKRLLPLSSNLRWKWFTDDVDEEEFDDQSLYPTPNYNSLILFDCRLRATTDYLTKVFSAQGELSNGLKLFKIWLEQRQLSQGFGSFSGAMPAFFLAHLLHTNKINRQMYSYQLFRIALVALTDSDYLSNKCSSLTEEKIIEWKEQNPFADEECVLIDQSGLLNVFHTLSRANYNRLKHEARLSLSTFNDSVIDQFQTLFMTSMKPIYSMDAVIQIASLDQHEKVLEGQANQNQLLMDNLNNKHYLVLRALLRLLERGLKERLYLICPLPESDQTRNTWAINETVSTRSTATFGLLFSDQYDLTVLKGPENGTEEALAFRKLWSERCELRRFPDGLILESVVWNVDTAKDKRLVWMDTTRYLLELHAGVSPTNISFTHNDQHPSNLLSIPARLLPSYGTGDEQQIQLGRQLIDLTKQIRTLNADLPLKIASIVGLDETFRYTNVFPPLPASFVTDLHKIRSIEHETAALIPRSTSRYAPPYSPSLLILCQLEMTSSNDTGFETVERIQHSKVLFYLQLAKLLQSKFHYPCRATAVCCYIEKESYIYRLIISYHKEIYLMESDAGRKEGLERTLTQTNLSRKLRYQIEYLPKINAAIYGVSQQYVHYQLVSRLFKRWLSSQLLLHHVDSINADLLCCYIFLHAAPYQPPKSIFTGFCRILRLLCDFDWLNEPLIINFNHELTSDQIFEMQKQFKADRSKLPAMCLMPSVAFHDHQQPTVPILKRLIQLAKEARLYLEIHPSDSIKFLFRPSTNLYDVIIMLDPLQCPRAYQAVDHLTAEVTYTTRKLPTNNTENGHDSSMNTKKKPLSIVDYDPPQLFVNDLRKSFNDQAEFFHDEFGGLMVCVLWKPSKSSTQGQASIDYVKIIDQWKSLGTGIIKEIRTFPERWC